MKENPMWVHAADELEMGRQVEQEHAGTLRWLMQKLGKDPKEAQALLDEAVERIAKDHIQEDASYYSKLKTIHHD